MEGKWNFTNDKPIYFQIAEEIKRRIISEEYSLGEKIPGVRDLAIEAGVNHNTMQRALSELERTGLIYSQRTNGRFVTEDKELIMSTKNEIADEKIQGFLKSMKQLGYTKEETIALLEKFKEEWLYEWIYFGM